MKRVDQAGPTLSSSKAKRDGGAPVASRSRRSSFQPWAHQFETAEFALEHNEIYDMSDPGTGKTAAHLLANLARTSEGLAKRTLIVCPKTLMRSAWGDEIDRYFAGGLSYALADAGRREQAFRFDTSAVIVNTDGVVELAKNPKWLDGFTDLIVDEASAFKHYSSQRSKALKAVSRRFQHIALLTGTPNPISVTELWHPMLILDGGQRLGASFFHFRNSVQISKQIGPMPNMVKWEDKPSALEAVHGLIKDITIRHAFEEVMTHVPPNHVSRYEFTLKPSLYKQYLQLETQAVLAAAEGTITAVHAASLRQKLLQLASGAVYTGDENKYVVLDTQRYELILDLVHQYRHSVVFFNWKHQRDQLQQLFSSAGVAFAIIDGDTKDHVRQQIVNDFQAGKYQTLLLHPRTGAHGLTLTAGEACILASPIYEADYLKQAIHRIYRGAQDKVTNTVLVQAKGTVEDLVYERLNAKMHNMNDFLQLVVESRKRNSYA